METAEKLTAETFRIRRALMTMPLAAFFFIHLLIACLLLPEILAPSTQGSWTQRW